MNKTLHKTIDDAVDLKDDIQQLIRATTDIADDRIIEARKRLASSLGSATEACGHGMVAARAFMRGHPSETALMACLAGLATGWLLARFRD